MDTDPSPGDPDIHMPGGYWEDPASGSLPTGIMDKTPVSAGPTIPSRQTRQAPARFRDILPEPPAPAPTSPPQLPRVCLMVTNPLETIVNSFGLFRQYLFHPSYDPDALVDPGDLLNISTSTAPPAPPRSEEADRSPPWPFSNMSIWRLMDWMNSRSKSKSESEVNRLVNSVLNAPNFHAKDLCNLNVRCENARLDAADRTSPLENSFQVADITIKVPTGQLDDLSTHHTYSVPGLHYRKLLNVIKAAFQEPLSHQFHLTPFLLMHRSPITNKEQQVYGELYNSSEFIEEHKRIQNWSPPPPDDPTCKLEKVIAALMFWSDATHLTNFRTAKLWPIYLFFGNLSKYIHLRPSSGACNHLAYIPSVCTLNTWNACSYLSTSQLPDSFESWISGWHPHWDTQRGQIMAHCRRELMQAVWRYLLDDDFIHAMRYRVVVTCHDGVRRRIYPRIFTYSADYPEK